VAELTAGQFRDFFFELHGYGPFPWQASLAERVCELGWPEVIDLPTSSGKTACIDIALFALAVRSAEALPRTPRRIFFVVDRRVIVNEASQRMRRVQKRLREATKGIVFTVAQRLRELSGVLADGDDDPLLVAEMRGGAYRDESWVRNPMQAAVITSTVDQVGSRLLFRGYGVGQNQRSVQAGLIGNDALILLDEAHCSRPFAQTLKRVKRYRGHEWARKPLESSFQFVEMTATPSGDVPLEDRVRLSDADLMVEALRKRLEAEKPTRLVPPIAARKNDAGKLVEELADQAMTLAEEVDARRVAVFVNRVKTARLVYERLREQTQGDDATVELVIGSMRPVDREDLEARLMKNMKSGRKRSADAPLTFVVSTQCLEVGADLDFDVLVSECASIDALLQRFGRLDRLGEFERARGAVVVGSWQIDAKQTDPVYGEALSNTWTWLNQLAADGQVNMGIQARAGHSLTVKELLDQLASEMKLKLHRAAENAAILLPAHVDMLSQTSPDPCPDPAVEIYLHGPEKQTADVQVVWRKDIEGVWGQDAIEIVKLCPPSSREAMSVSIAAFRKWFAGDRDVLAQESDIEGGTEEDGSGHGLGFSVIVWDDEDSKEIFDPNEIKPGQTIVVRASEGGWNELGHIPDDVPIDVADRAAFTVRNAVSLRLHPEIIDEWSKSPSWQALFDALNKQDAQWKRVQELLESYGKDLEANTIEQKKPWPWDFVNAISELKRVEFAPYPRRGGGESTGIGYVVRARRSRSKKSNERQVFLDEHTNHVVECTTAASASLGQPLRDAIVCAAKMHDWGKADIRFQAWLRGGDVMAARYSPKPIAKSGKDNLLDQKAVGLPAGFRHELLSLQLAEKATLAQGEMRDLVLHLVASHHGKCRPFAPIVQDDSAESVSYNEITIGKEERSENAPHRLSSGIADRFWRLTAIYGWWGLAYLEALLRLSDWHASSEEASEAL
jgi:CRISPR-associated endonuclease/helicase Cas3